MVTLSNIEKISTGFLDSKKINVFVKRDDEIHPLISGNKYRKLVYAIEKMKKEGVKCVMTFGGAYSNHIHAFSYAAKINGFKSIGIIRGDELKDKPLNETLSFAKENGMELIFVSRKEYKKRNEKEYINKMIEKYKCAVIPEGGTQYYSKFGLKDMITEINCQVETYDWVVSAVGTGGTISGIIDAIPKKATALGIMVLKGIEKDTIETISDFTEKKNYELVDGYHFGGYAKYNEELIDFINKFKEETGIQLEQVYTGKAMFALYDMIKRNKFKENTNIVFIHTGGLQGLLKK